MAILINKGMKKIKTFAEFLNEAAPAPAAPAAKAPVQPAKTPAEDDEFNFSEPTDPNNPTANATTPPATGATPTDPNAPVDPTTGAPADPNAPPADGSAPTDASAAGATDPGASGGGGIGSGGASTPPPPSSGSTGASPSGAGAPPPPSGGAPPPPAPEAGDNESKKPGDYVPPVSKFKIVLMDKGTKWSLEYPDGGGVKEMPGYEIDWKDLNTWIDKNKLGDHKEKISEYLLGEKDELDDSVKDKLKNAITSKSIGDDIGRTEVEFDDDQTPYVSDINTVIVNL